MKDQRIFLKVKAKSLAAEAAIIRQETARAPKEFRSDLSAHRRTAVRSAARNTQLAYAFLRGRRYRQVEPNSDTPPNWKEVGRMVKQYGIQAGRLVWNGSAEYATYAAAKADEEKRLAAWMMEAPAACPA